jgi:hypothetical protein
MQTYLEEKTLTDRLMGWWYAIATPSIKLTENTPLKVREVIRKSKFLSIILFIEIILSLADYVKGFAYGTGLRLFIPVTISVASLFAGVILNRKGKMLTAVTVILVVFEINMGYFLLTGAFAPGGQTPFNVITYIILLQPSIIAASLLPAPIALSIGLLNSLFTTVMIIFPPGSMEMISQPPGVVFNAAYDNISTQVVVMIINIFWTRSIQQEMQRADRAEEVNRLIEELAEQQQLALEEKQRLEESVQQIVHVHTQVANGDLNARVPLDQGNVLWLIAGSLNNLLSRLQRWRQDAKKQQLTEQAIQYLILALQTAKRQGTQISVQKTGTPIDPLIAEIINDPSFARPDHAHPHHSHPETPFPAISSSWSAGTAMPPDASISSWSDQVPFQANNIAPHYQSPFNMPMPER